MLKNGISVDKIANMQKFIESLTEILDGAKKLEFDNIVFGRENHPRKTDKKIILSDFAQKVRHFSVEHHEVACVTEGQCIINMNGMNFKLKKGDLCFIHSWVEHTESYVNKNTGYKIVWLYHDPAYILMMHESSYRGETGFHHAKNNMAIRINTGSVNALNNIFNYEGPKEKTKVLKEKIEEWFAILRGKLDKGEYDYSNRELIQQELLAKIEKIKKSVEYMNKNFKQDLSLKEIADRSFLSPKYISGIFREIYYITISECLALLRLREACKLLKNSKLSIKEIGNKVGYGDPYFFSRIFKKYIGLAPEQYRSQNRQKAPEVCILIPFSDEHTKS